MQMHIPMAIITPDITSISMIVIILIDYYITNIRHYFYIRKLFAMFFLLFILFFDFNRIKYLCFNILYMYFCSSDIAKITYIYF